MDEALLSEVGDALQAQADLAHRQTDMRMEATSRLLEHGMALRGRMRRQAVLLRERVALHERLIPELRDALDEVEQAISEAAELQTSTRWTLTTYLPRDRTCAVVARRLIESRVRDDLAAEDADAALLITSELVTNALLHGHGAILLNAERSGDRLRIDVCDEGHPAHVEATCASPEDSHGRGLWIVNNLASSWGHIDGTSQVWAELDLAHTSRPQPARC